VNGVVKPIMRNIKTSYYRNNCKNSNEIVHNRNHHHVRFVGGRNMRPTNEAEAHAHLSPPLLIPSLPFSPLSSLYGNQVEVWQTAAILKKNQFYRDIFTTVGPILTKFGMATHIVSAGRP